MVMTWVGYHPEDCFDNLMVISHQYYHPEEYFMAGMVTPVLKLPSGKEALLAGW